MSNINDMISNLTCKESLLYNDIIKKFNTGARDILRPVGGLRLGQAFYGYGFTNGIIKGAFPELFYCEDNNKALEMIVSLLCVYVKEIEYVNKCRIDKSQQRTFKSMVDALSKKELLLELGKSECNNLNALVSLYTSGALDRNQRKEIYKSITDII